MLAVWMMKTNPISLPAMTSDLYCFTTAVLLFSVFYANVREINYSLISLNIPGTIYTLGIETLLSSVGKSLQFSAAIMPDINALFMLITVDWIKAAWNE